MSLHKMFSVLCLASVIGSGCGVEPEDTSRDAVQQAIRGDGWSSTNYNQLFSATLEGQTVTGLYFSGGAWFVSTASSLTYAQVTSIAYNGQAIAPQNLTTAQGSFLVIGADAEDASVELVLTVAAPLAGTLRITAASTATDGSFSRYTTQWVSAHADDATTSVGLCPREVLVTKTTTQTVYETMIPIGGARWNLSGSKVSDANAITLGCSQDAIGGCVEWGYGPWGTRPDEVTGKPVSMASVHQACTRMKRDDVCGSGSPLTTGYDAAQGVTTIHVKDRVGIHADTNQTLATMEAFWNENGASCFNESEYRSTNTTLLQRLAIIKTQCPSRFVACTSSHSGVLLSARPCTLTSAAGECVAN